MKTKDKCKPVFGVVGDHANVLSPKILSDFSLTAYLFPNENKEQTGDNKYNHQPCTVQRHTACTRQLYIAK
jgi:hypothetical protein